MDGRRADRKAVQRCVKSKSVTEHEYSIADEEEVHHVQIHPSKPMTDEQQYADRDFPRSSRSSNFFSVCSINEQDTDSRYLRRGCHPPAAPAIHRDLKPGKQKRQLDIKPPPVQPGNQIQPSQRCSLPCPTFTWPLGETQESCKTGEDRRARPEANNIRHTCPNICTSHSKPLKPSKPSLNLDKAILELRCARSLDKVRLNGRPHEWPQTKEDTCKHVGSQVDQPPQAHTKEEWYVGDCSRTDAVHALHLVNKDGAFLVRDSTININSEPLVLMVFNERKVYNVKIRYNESTGKYTLGKNQHPHDVFNCVKDIIRYHSIFPICLISGRYKPGNKTKDNCVLTYPVAKGVVLKLLH